MSDPSQTRAKLRVIATGASGHCRHQREQPRGLLCHIFRRANGGITRVRYLRAYIPDFIIDIFEPVIIFFIVKLHPRGPSFAIAALIIAKCWFIFHLCGPSGIPPSIVVIFDMSTPEHDIISADAGFNGRTAVAKTTAKTNACLIVHLTSKRFDSVTSHQECPCSAQSHFRLSTELPTQCLRWIKLDWHNDLSKLILASSDGASESTNCRTAAGLQDYVK